MRAWGVALILCLAAVAAGCNRSTPIEDCPDPSVLAAAADMEVGLSCAEAVQYRGETLYVGCVKVHPSRIGRVILKDGGRTGYSGARAIVGVAPARALILLGDSCGSREIVGTVEGFKDSEYELVRSPRRGD